MNVVFTRFLATHAGILTSHRSTGPHDPTSTHAPILSKQVRYGGNAPLPIRCNCIESRSFGGRLEPRYIFGAEPLDQ